MRIGHNPARFVEKVAQPAGITVAVVNCIPFLSGYYEQSLEIIKTVVESLNATREQEHPYDVMLFDNHSCAEVREYLQGAYNAGKIQYLVLSDTNIGKIGAWNFMFGAAQGEMIVFSDGDVEFRPGWLSASLELFEKFPHVGMVTARPLRTPMEYSTATLEWARAQSGQVYAEGHFLDWDTYRDHVLSLGITEEQAQEDFRKGSEHRLNYRGVSAYIGSTHFEFMARRETLQKVIPLPSDQPMRGERTLDIAVNDLGLLRLTTSQPFVWHLGNRLTAPAAESKRGRTGLLRRLLWWAPIRSLLLWLNNKIFRLYFFNVK